MNIAPAEALIFGDSPLNVAAVQEVGLHAVRLEGAAQVRHKLTALRLQTEHNVTKLLYWRGFPAQNGCNSLPALELGRPMLSESTATSILLCQRLRFRRGLHGQQHRQHFFAATVHAQDFGAAALAGVDPHQFLIKAFRKRFGFECMFQGAGRGLGFRYRRRRKVTCSSADIFRFPSIQLPSLPTEESAFPYSTVSKYDLALDSPISFAKLW